MLGNRWRYSWSAFAGDCFGGVAAALVAIPYGLAMASLMGLPPVFGLLTSIITSPITALFGRNRVLIGERQAPRCRSSPTLLARRGWRARRRYVWWRRWP